MNNSPLLHRPEQTGLVRLSPTQSDCSAFRVPHSPFRISFILPTSAFILFLAFGQSAQAATYTYNNITSNSTPGTSWSVGTNWNATPVSGTTTTLSFQGTLGGGATIFTNNNIAGTFQLNALSFTYAGPGSGAVPIVTISGNALDFRNNGATAPVLTINSSGTVKPILVINNNLVLTNTTTINAATTGTLAGNISGAGGLTKSGAGAVTLSASNNYTGATTVSAGTLNLTSSNTGGGATTVQGGGTLAITGTGSINPTTGAALSLGASSSAGTLQYDSSATSKFAAITIGNGTTTPGTLNQTSGLITATSLTLNNGYSGTGTGTLNLSGGTMTISGATTVSGQTSADNILSTLTVSGSGILNASGELRLTGLPSTGRYADGKLVQTSGTVTVAGANGLVLVQGTLGNTAIRRGQYDLNGGTLNVNTITSTSTSGSDAVAIFNLNGGNLRPTASTATFWVNNAQTTANVLTGGAKIDTNGFNITIAQPLVSGTVGDGGLAKSGTGTLTLSGSSSYVGPTTVTLGTLNLTGTLGNTATTISSGAVIAGEGAVGTTGSLTLSNGSFVRVDASTAGALTIGGNLAINATTTVILDVLPVTTGSGTSFRVLNYNGSLTGTSTNLALQSSGNYRGYSFSTATANQVNMSIDTKSVTWSGGSSAWDINNSLNWDSGAEKFYQGDAVTFTDSGTNKTVTITGTTVLPASVTFNNSAGNDYTVNGSGAIGGAASLSKSGSGALTLSTTNSYSGGTTVSSGTLVANVAGALGSGAVTNNATLNLTAGGVTYTGISSALSGSGTTNVTLGVGSASTILNGDYSGYTGTWNIGTGATAGAGKVQMNGLDNAAATINVLQHGTLYTTSGTHNASLFLNGGDTGESIGQLRIEAGANWAGPITLTGDITGSGDFTVAANTSSGTISGNIGQSGGPRAFVKGGSGTITLSGTNTYTGATTVSAGTLKLGNAGAFGDGVNNTSSVTIGGSSILDLNGISPTANVTLNLNSSASGNNVGSLTNTSNGVAAGSTGTFGGAVIFGATTVVVGGGDNTGGSGSILLTGAITGNGKNLTKNGLGSLELSTSGTVALGTLTVTRGGIQVDSGTTLNATGLTLGNGVTVGASLTLNGGSVTSTGTPSLSTTNSTTTTVTIGSGSTLTVPNFNKGSAGTSLVLIINGGTLKANAPSATFMNSATGFTAAKIQSLGATIDDGGFAITIGQSLIEDTGSTGGGLTKSGTGTLTLTASNGYTGATVVNGGTLKLGNNNALPSSPQAALTVTGTGTLDLSGFNAGITSLSGDSSSFVINTVSGTNTLTVSGTTSTAFDGQIQDAGGVIALAKTGSGTLTLTGSNSYGGGTTLTSGTLVAGNDNALGTGLMTLNGGNIASNDAARLISNAVTVTGTVGNNVAGDSITFTGAAGGSGTLNVNLSGTAKTMTVSRASDDGFAPGRIKMTQGTLVLGGSNVIGNSTNIDLAGGTLNTGGNTETAGALTLSANSTIDFSGSQTGDVTFTDANYSGGLLTINNWVGSFGGGSTTHLVFTGSIDPGLLSQVQFTGGGYSQGANAIVFGGGYELAPIPEPATIIGALAFVGLLFVRERRRFAELAKRFRPQTCRAEVSAKKF